MSTTTSARQPSRVRRFLTAVGEILESTGADLNRDLNRGRTCPTCGTERATR